MKDLMHYKGYCGSVHFDDENLIFYGKVEFIRALVSYEATDAKGLHKAFEEAVDDYLEMCVGQKIEAEKPFKGSLNVRLGAELHRLVAMEAERHLLLTNLLQILKPCCWATIIMMTTLKNKLKKLPPVHRKKINKRVKELIADKMTARGLRKVFELT